MTDLGRQMLVFSNGAGAKAVTRILAAQARNFPELAELAYREGWSRAVSGVAQLFDQMAGQGLSKIDTTVAAECYLDIVVGPVSRQAIYGIPINITAEEKRMRTAVRLFLKGILSN